LFLIITFIYVICHVLFFFFLAFYKQFRSIATTTTCIHWSLSLASSAPFSIPSSSKSLSTLSFHLCLGRLLGLFVFGFQFVTCPIILSDLHTWPAHLSLLLFKTPLMVASPYRSLISWFVLVSYLPSLFFLGVHRSSLISSVQRSPIWVHLKLRKFSEWKWHGQLQHNNQSEVRLGRSTRIITGAFEWFDRPTTSHSPNCRTSTFAHKLIVVNIGIKEHINSGTKLCALAKSGDCGFEHGLQGGVAYVIN